MVGREWRSSNPDIIDGSSLQVVAMPRDERLNALYLAGVRRSVNPVRKFVAVSHGGLGVSDVPTYIMQKPRQFCNDRGFLLAKIATKLAVLRRRARAVLPIEDLKLAMRPCSILTGQSCPHHLNAFAFRANR